MRHEFAINDLGAEAGWFKGHRYVYFCVRCRWTFLVVNRRGDAIALNEAGQPLPEAENLRRQASFALGPCEAASQWQPIAASHQPAATSSRPAPGYQIERKRRAATVGELRFGARPGNLVGRRGVA
ncbi:MAG TPA: hypothetical protein VMD75_12240 [Candidatus Binataceae bacterium]|nr:hypothetical protein [Candidatus Binataceae bacterium]